MSVRSQQRARRAAPPAGPGRPRIVAVDALRGLALVILLLVNTAGIHDALPAQLRHPDWHGLTVADTFFPAFLFTMGAAMAFSTRAGRAAGVVRRVALLFAIGVAISWVRNGAPAPNGILQKIAIAYLVAWLVLRLPVRLHLPAAVLMVIAAWAAYASVPAPWEPGSNLGAAIDRAAIGHPSTEGLSTALLASINVIGGSLVVRGLRSRAPSDAVRRLLAWAAGATAVGLLIAVAVPVNKRMWTPSFIVLSHGIVCAYLAGFWWIGEAHGRARSLRPLVVLGRNPILVYVVFTVAHELLSPVRVAWMPPLADAITPMGASLAWSAVMTAAGVALAAWLDRRRLYLRV